MVPGIVENTVDYHTNNIATSTLDINSVLCDQNFDDCIIPIYNINNVSENVQINKLERYRFPKNDPLEMLSCYKDKRSRQEILTDLIELSLDRLNPEEVDFWSTLCKRILRYKELNNLGFSCTNYDIKCEIANYKKLSDKTDYARKQKK